MEGISSRKNKAKLHKPFDDVGAVLHEKKALIKTYTYVVYLLMDVY
ncbi:hypothetical protein OA501_02750 [Flavobacteriaceae bacterium]|nr:hypothetical protein [Flavobacteriaceae bacterium]